MAFGTVLFAAVSAGLLGLTFWRGRRIAEPVSEVSSPFLADSPISTRGQDKLGRERFAARLADIVATVPAETGLVVGLSAPWGEGKSSALAMTREVLASDYWNSRIVIVQFNPWLWSGTGQLIQQFFAALSGALSPSAGWPDWLAPMMRNYGAAISALGLLDTALAPALTALGAVSQALSRVAPWWRRNPEDLSRWRKALVTEMARAPRRLVVFVDDVDRLQDSEILEMAQLVKLTGDFPNVVYLLAYDRSRVEEAVSKSGGQSYLDKIVQLAIDLPAPDSNRLDQYRLELLAEAVRPLPDRLWQQPRWALLYNQVLQPVLRTLRDSKRFANAVAVASASVGEDVNGVDLVAVTAIRLFMPTIHRRMLEDPSIFVGGLFVLDRRQEREQRKAQIQELVDSCPRFKAEALAVLRFLFPLVDGAFSNTEYGEKDWTPDLRINGSAVYPRYFTLMVPSRELNESQLEAVFRLAPDQMKEFEALLTGLLRSDFRDSLVDRLMGWSDGLPRPTQRTVIVSLLRLWLEFPEEWTGFLQLSPRRRVGVAAIRHLRGIDDLDERVIAALGFVGDGQIEGSMYVAQVCESDESMDAIIDQLHFPAIRELAVRRLLQLSDEDLLSGSTWWLLFLIKKWSGQASAAAFLDRLTGSDERFLTMLGKAVAVRHHSQGSQTRAVRYVDEKAISEFLDLDEVKGRARRLLEAGSGTPEQLKVLELLLQPPADPFD